MQDNDCKISENESKCCEGLLMVAECLGSFKAMESNKKPGMDGIPANFYKIFWNDIKSSFLDSVNVSYAKGLLSISQRRGLCHIKN